MSTAPSPPKAPPKPPAKPSTPPAAAKPPPPASTPRREVGIVTGIQQQAQRIVVYGPGGVGKTSLAALLKGALIVDIEQRSGFLDVARAYPLTWEEMRDVLHGDCSQFAAIVIDSLTKAEELATTWTIENVKHEKGHFVSSVEGYGFGKGLTHVYETFLQLLGDLDAHIRAGRHVVCIAHECVSNVPNPTGDDWLRYEPRLQSPGSGKNSIRHRVKEWCDHLLYLGYDTFAKDGKATGSGSRTIYPAERPSWWAKSTKLSEEIVYEKDSAELWNQLFSKG